MPVQLREYQVDALEAIQSQWNRGFHSTLAELFTSAGKTVIFVEYVKRHIDLRERRALVMTPAHLILQTKLKFSTFYPEFDGWTDTKQLKRITMGVEMADLTQPSARLIIGSVPTVIDRVPTDFEPITKGDLIVDEHGGIKKSPRSTRKVLISHRMDDILSYGMIDEIIFDEAHHAVAPGGFMLISRLWEICKVLGLPPTRLIGFTATAFRDDGLALSNLFQTICIRRSQRWAEQHGYTAPLKPPIRVHVRVPLGKEEVLNAGNWADLIVQAWLEKGEGRPILGYWPSVESSREVTKAFQTAGIPAAHLESTVTIGIDGSAHDDTYRETIYEQFLTGKCQIINNYGVILEGTDLPPASCMMWGRETENIVLTTQAIGRIIRLFDGNQALPPKQDALIIDITAGDLTVLTAGTLAGFRIDPDTGIYVKDQDDEIEVEVSDDGKDIRDVEKGVIYSSGLIYSIGKLIRKSGSDWYHDERYDVLSLGISMTDSIIIVPPFYTLATFLNNVENKLEAELEKHYSQEGYNEYANVSNAKTLFENYTLWHYKKGNTPASWVQKDISLDRLMDFTIPYMNDQSDPISSFINKSSSWKRKPMSDAQKNLLTNLTQKHKIEFDPLWTQGEASQIISHIFSFNEGVRIRIAQMYKSIAEYLNV